MRKQREKLLIVDAMRGERAMAADKRYPIREGYIYVIEAVGIGRYKIGKRVTHDAVRALLMCQELALVSPLRNLDGGFWMDPAYRHAQIRLPCDACLVERSAEGRDILVFEPKARL